MAGAQGPLDAEVRWTVYDAFVREGHPPSPAALAARLAVPEADLAAALRRLAAGRALVLGPGQPLRVAVAHPFAALPTPFRVGTPRGTWWGNCIWDALGIPAMLGTDATIETRSGAIGAPMTLEVRGGEVRGEGVVHFAIPARRWWDDVTLTCATNLVFRDEAEVDPWCKRHGVPRGAVFSLEQANHLGHAWYGDRLRKDWRRKTVEEAEAVFREAGLGGPFWALR